MKSSSTYATSAICDSQEGYWKTQFICNVVHCFVFSCTTYSYIIYLSGYQLENWLFRIPN